jgi:SAM-dependent methyltransferase
VAIDQPKLNETAERVLGYLTGMGVGAMIYIGDKLGLYRAMDGAGPLTAKELAAKTNLNERWVHEWLHGQVAARLVDYRQGEFELTAENGMVLSQDDSPAFLSGGFQLMLPLLSQTDRMTTSFKTGRGTPYNDLGLEHAIGENRFSFPWMKANLVSNVLPKLEGVTQKLTAGAVVADVGCGSGRTLLEIAGAFPESRFEGYDNAALAIRLAEENQKKAGVTNALFYHKPATELPAEPRYDFVLTWDCLHDMGDPASAIRAIRRAIKPDGCWLIVDVAGADTPEGNYDHPMGALLYSFSILDCMAPGSSGDKPAQLGTLGFPEPVARRMVSEAGFTRFTRHTFADNPLNSFYEVRP